MTTAARGKLICTSCRKQIDPAAEHVKLEDSRAGRNYYFHQGGCSDSAYRLLFSHRPGRYQLGALEARALR